MGREKIGGRGGGVEVLGYCRLATFNLKVPRVWDSTVAGGSEFQSRIVLGTKVLFLSSVLHLTRSYIFSWPLLPDLDLIGLSQFDE